MPFRQSLQTKILAGYGVALVLLIAVLVLGYVNLNRLGRASDSILQENYRSIRAAEQMIDAIERQDSGTLLYLLGRREEGLTEFREGQTRFQRWLSRAQDNVTIEGEQQVLDRIDSTYTAYTVAFTELLEAGAPAPPDTASYASALAPRFRAVRQHVTELRDLNQETMFSASDRAQEIANRAKWALGVAGGLVIVIGLAFSTVLARRITRPLEGLTEAASRIAEGDYDVEVEDERSDEVGELARQFNEMAGELRRFRRLNLEQIMAEKRKSEAIVRNIDEGLIVVDDDLKVANINPAAGNLLEVPESEVTGRHAMELIGHEGVIERLREALASGEPPEIPEEERYLTFSEGEERRHHQLSVTPVIGEDGATIGAVLMLRDVTALRKLERRKTEFVASASHELKTPLTSMGMSLDLLEERSEKLDEEERQLVEGLQADVGRLRDLVEDLLRLSRLEAGEIELDVQAVPVELICEKVREVFERQAAEAGVELVFDVHRNETIRADVTKATWVLTNLLSNAIRYSDSGDRVEVVTSRRDGWMEIAVSDEGTGIPYEYQARIFDRFVQLENEDHPGGSGLGLTISREIVRAHGGSIWVDSVPGGGSTFTFTLPTL